MPQVHEDRDLVRDEEMLASYLGELIRQCEDHATYQQEYRGRSLQYYNGEMKDLSTPDGRVDVVYNDLRATYKKLKPSIERTFFGNQRLVEYVPTSARHIEYAKQATEYVNKAIVGDKKCGVETALRDAIFDALIVRTGILSWEAFQERKVERTEYQAQPEEALFGLQGEGMSVEDMEQYPGPGGQSLYNFTLIRTVENTRIVLSAVPRGSFLIMPDVDSIEESALVGERLQMTRSDLVSRGYDPEEVAKVSARKTPDDFEDGYSDEPDYKGDDYQEHFQREISRAMEEVTVYKVYVKLDRDGDGITELYKMLLGDAVSDSRDMASPRYVILHDEMVSEAPYAKVVAESEPHQFEGHSLSEDVMPIQRIKTALLREALDNIHWQNNLQPAIDRGALEDLDSVLEPDYSRPIWLKRGTDVRQAVQWREVPSIAEGTFDIMERLSNINKEHTGVSDMSGGMDLEKFQSMAPTNAALISEVGTASAEMMLRELAKGGIRDAFRGLLKLAIAHGDPDRLLRLRSGRWVTYDPRLWDSEMDCEVNIGIGTGSRERDMLALQMVKQQQSEIVSGLGVDNPFVTPAQIYNTLAAMTEAAGLPSPDPYFTEPTDQDVQMLLQKQQEQESQSPDRIRAETQMKIAQMKMQSDSTKAQQQIAIERAQLEADISVKRDELQGKMALEEKKAEDHMKIEMLKFELEAMKARQELLLEREKAAMETENMYVQSQMKLQEMDQQLEFKRREGELDRHAQQHQMLMKSEEHDMRMRESRGQNRSDR